MAQAEKKRRGPPEDLQKAQPLDESRRASDALSTDQARHMMMGQRTVTDLRDIQSRMEAGQAARPPLQQIASENALIGQQIINTWLTDDFFAGTTHQGPGPTTRDNFVSGNPHVITKPSDWFKKFAKSAGFIPAGISPWDSHDVFVSSSVLSTADRYNMITHELLHEAAEANGGMDMYYIGEGGRRMPVGYVRWFHEGTTELFAQELVRAHGITPSYVSYPYETMTCFLIQGILIESYGEEEGRRIMRDAYLTGDMSIIRNTIDSTLGRGTFDRLMGMDRGIEGADEIFTFMRSRAGASTLSWGGGTQVTWNWDQNPIAKHILREIQDPRVPAQRLAELLDQQRASRQR
jgi:hypothetical protein